MAKANIDAGPSRPGAVGVADVRAAVPTVRLGSGGRTWAQPIGSGLTRRACGGRRPGGVTYHAGLGGVGGGFVGVDVFSVLSGFLITGLL